MPFSTLLKSYARRAVLAPLTAFARARLTPDTTVIGITGSVGKTTTKEAIATIFAGSFTTLVTQKSFNSEFGVPLTLLEEASGYSSSTAWAGILARAAVKSRTPLSVEKVVLELGVDRPGDMDRHLTIVQPTIAVVLAAAPVHLAAGQFRSIDEIAIEKTKLIANLPGGAVAIVNADDTRIATAPTPARRLTFGMEQPADLAAREIIESADSLTATVTFEHQTAQLTVPFVGRHNLYPLLAALAVGIVSGVPLATAVERLATFHLPPGRGNLFAGVNGSRIIDATYNANPASVTALLDTLARLPPSGKKIALLGQMNELGDESGTLHHTVGDHAAVVADEVIGVYGDAEIIVAHAKAAGKSARFFGTAREAGEYLRGSLAAGDIVLAKGSQNHVRLELAVREILANPADTMHLCRQEAEWIAKV